MPAAAGEFTPNAFVRIDSSAQVLQARLFSFADA
jgi:hypothetical protein